MAEQELEQEPPHQSQKQEEELKKLACSYLGLSFSMFLALVPKKDVPLVQNVQSQLRDLSVKLYHTEEQVRQMRSRRQEDSKANARVVEIFATHRNAWQAEEKRLLRQIDTAAEEIARLRARVAELENSEAGSKARVEELEREVGEREEMIRFMSRREGEEEEEEEEGLGRCRSREYGGGKSREWFQDVVDEVDVIYEQSQQYHHHHEQQQQQQQHLGSNGFDSEFLASASMFWAEKASLWQVCSIFLPTLSFLLFFFFGLQNV